MKLPGGYRLPEGATMTDVCRLDHELLSKEGLEVQGPKVTGDPEETSSEEE